MISAAADTELSVQSKLLRSAAKDLDHDGAWVRPRPLEVRCRRSL